MFYDSGDDPNVPKGPGDGATWHDRWAIGHNWRESLPPDEGDQFRKAWVPPGEADVQQPEIAGLEKDEQAPNYLRPTSGSRLAVSGSGTDYLPKWVGATAPEDVKSWDWSNVWQKLASKEQGAAIE